MEKLCHCAFINQASRTFGCVLSVEKGRDGYKIEKVQIENLQRHALKIITTHICATWMSYISLAARLAVYLISNISLSYIQKLRELINRAYNSKNKCDYILFSDLNIQIDKKNEKIKKDCQSMQYWVLFVFSFFFTILLRIPNGCSFDSLRFSRWPP